MKDFQHGSAGHAYPPDLAPRRITLHAEERFHTLGRGVGDTDEGAAEDLPVELHAPVEVGDGNARVTERSRFHVIS
jgi:hypothetical protein